MTAARLLERSPFSTSYTPIHATGDAFDLLVKHYPQGSISRLLQQSAAGDQLLIRGPIEALPYSPNVVKQIGMVKELT